MMAIMPTIVHFDVPADDTRRAQAFYSDLFEWTFETAQGAPMEYHLFATKNLDGSSGVGGGLGPRGAPDQQVMIYIGVPSVATYLERVQKLGGSIIMPRTPIPGVGSLAICEDTEGNRFGLVDDVQTVS
jgi:predicted enzyme related to lactoylglutathione lyase